MPICLLGQAIGEGRGEQGIKGEARAEGAAIKTFWNVRQEGCVHAQGAQQGVAAIRGALVPAG